MNGKSAGDALIHDARTGISRRGPRIRSGRFSGYVETTGTPSRYAPSRYAPSRNAPSRNASSPGALLGAVAAVVLALTAGCASTGGKARPLAPQLDEAATAFFADAAQAGTRAQAYFALFLPQGTVDGRHLVAFRDALEGALRRGGPGAGLQYNASADRIFFLSRHRAPGWDPPAGADDAAETLARAFLLGTPEGWTAFHALWGQYNRLLIGDDAWIQNLPDSIRADLSHPLSYLVRAEVVLTDNPDAVTFRHDLILSIVEVGKERTRFTGRYPLTLTHALR